MALTEFGKAVRKARIEVGATMSEMAAEMEVTPVFLSFMEKGQKRIPDGWAEKMEAFFKARGLTVRLCALANLSNKNVPLRGLPPDHQMLIAELGCACLSEGDLLQIRRWLAAAPQQPTGVGFGVGNPQNPPLPE